MTMNSGSNSGGGGSSGAAPGPKGDNMASDHAFLAEASRILASSLDFEATLASVARLAVPHFADWCAIDIATPPRETYSSPDVPLRYQRLAVTHIDPTKIARAHEMERRYPSDADAPTGVPHVLRTGKSELYPDITDEMLVAGAQDADHLAFMREIGFRSAMVVPLMARDRTLGAITFVAAESGRHYAPPDVPLAEELARRAAIAIDNAYLYRQAQMEVEERRRAEAAVKAAEERLRQVVTNVPVLVFALDRNGIFTFLDGKVLHSLGVTAQEIVGTSIFDVFANRPEILADLRAALSGEKSETVAEFSERIFEIKTNLLSASDGLIGVAYDITDRVKAEQALVESQTRTRAFLSDVLMSVTEGRLRLCDSPADLPEPCAAEEATVPLSADGGGLRALRRQAMNAATALHFPPDRRQDLLTAVSEAAMNAIVHAGGGMAFVNVEPERGIVQVRIEDRGKGIAVDTLPRATLERGYSSAGTLGHGFWLMLKTCDRIHLLTGPEGTTVVLEQERAVPSPSWLSRGDAETQGAVH